VSWKASYDHYAITVALDASTLDVAHQRLTGFSSTPSGRRVVISVRDDVAPKVVCLPLLHGEYSA